MAHLQFPKHVIEFIKSNEHTDLSSLALKKSPFVGYSMKQIVQQVQGRKVAKEKFPFLLEVDQYRYPPKESLEQASSEKTARFKSSLMEGEKFVDLTGGMGIDTYLIGQHFSETTYVEPNTALFEQTTANFSNFGFNSFKAYNQNCEAFIHQTTNKFDWAFIDPSRRVEGSRKTSIHKYSPNLVELQDQISSIANNIMVKLSPMQDISECVDVLKHVHFIWVISVENEVKELLLHLREGEDRTKLTALELAKNKDIAFESDITDRMATVEYSTLQKYLYQPSSALVKAGLQNSFSKSLGLTKLHPNTQLFTSDQYYNDYFGRVFEVRHITQLNKKSIKKLLPQLKANVISKNFPLSPSQIKTKLRISDGGTDYLIAFTGSEEKKVVAICTRLV